MRIRCNKNVILSISNETDDFYVKMVIVSSILPVKAKSVWTNFTSTSWLVTLRDLWAHLCYLFRCLTTRETQPYTCSMHMCELGKYNNISACSENISNYTINHLFAYKHNLVGRQNLYYYLSLRPQQIDYLVYGFVRMDFFLINFLILKFHRSYHFQMNM